MDFLAYLPLAISATVLFVSSIGIYRAKNTLQAMHYCTIIDIVCIPLALITTLTTLSLGHTRVFYSIAIVMLLSPISSYFIGKLYYTIPKETV